MSIALVLVAAILLAGYAVYDKLVVFRYVTNEFFLSFVSRTMIALLVVPLLLLPSITVPSTDMVLISLVAGCLYIITSLIYFTGVKKGDPSTMIVFLNSKPALVVITAAAFLGETLQPVQYGGILLVIGATLLLSFSRIEGSLKLRKTALYGAGFAIVAAAIDIISKYVVTSISPLTFFAIAGIAQGVGGVLGLVYLYRVHPTMITENTTYQGLRAIGIRTVLFVGGVALFFIALVNTPVSIASSVIATQTALTVLFIWLVVRLRKTAVSQLGHIPFTVKMVASLGIIAGVALISQPGILA